MKKLKLVAPKVMNKKEIAKRKKEIKEMDKWFYSLSSYQQADIAYNFWDNATYEQKAEEYYVE